MARTTGRRDPRPPNGTPQSGARRLIAGLRITRHDESLLAVVRPYLTDAGSESELAYRLWRRGLEITLAEVAGLGAELPPGTTEHLIASLVAQRLLLCMPLLRRTGRLALLGVETAAPIASTVAMPETPAPLPGTEVIDESASIAIAGLGGSDFL
ncbi:MAG: hypothetical protein HGA45_00715 [Chloroflexales bacterium]|nr:hypothetical protein [Chloroflexales bacterium]